MIQHQPPWHQRLVKPPLLAGLDSAASGLDRRLDSQGCFDGCEDVNIDPRRPNRHNQGVPSQSVDAFQVRLLLPPAPDREHADRVTLGEIGGAARPEIGVQRAAIAEGAEQPLFSASSRRPFLLVPSGLIDAGSEFVDCLGR